MFEGTWTGAVPKEIQDVILCYEFHTSPKRIREEWSAYQIRVAWDYLQLKWEAEKDADDKTRSQADQMRSQIRR